MVWRLGRFPSKTREVALPATVHFEPVAAGAARDPEEDPFCVGETSYVDLQYRQVDGSSSLSGAEVIPASVTVSGGPKVKIAVVHQVESRQYRIWNSLGQVQACLPPPPAPAAALAV